ncbi:LOW QUALITY PROTEIN: mitochondrial basic amino acids transporter-like [Ceratina calcarata]|uniref:Mitochondrial basic amino acids transporter n=1 Tax=Ceratina calcarata TaxID=156304 RepID=A0AAJ7RXW6_9HYME|nr:LOW QUALITY PROTEIN: mitochondrial basic amino acids transporter-like [Ceratina calcarata]
MALDFFAGCLGGCAGIMVGYPLDTIKVHMQTQDYRNPKYKGNWHCFRTLLAKESVGGLYRGMSSPVAGVAVVNAIIFGVYGETQRRTTDPACLSSHFIAGSLAGIAQSPICSPIELAKTRMQLQTSTTQFSGPVECLQHTYKHEGYRGVFKGLGVTLLREAPSFGVYFLTYEALTRASENKPVSTLCMLLAGGLAGTASWVISYPLDVIKSRIQAGGNRYSGVIDCLKQSVHTEGYSCLYRGLSSTIIRAFPTNAVTFTVVTWTFRLLGQEDVTPFQEKSNVVESIGDFGGMWRWFLERWNSFLTSASRGMVIHRLHCSAFVSTIPTNVSKLECPEGDKWTARRIEYCEQTRDDKYARPEAESSRVSSDDVEEDNSEDKMERAVFK